MEDLASLFDAEADAVYRYARLVTGSPHDADDIVQATFLRAAASWHAFAGKASRKTWLWSIVRHVLGDWQRRTARQRRRGHTLVSPAPPVGDVVFPFESLVAGLPLRERQVVVLRVIEDLSTEQTAERLHISQGSVRVALHRALRRLRTEFEGKEEVR